MKHPYVYILASGERRTLHVGVTGYLRERVHQHRAGLIEGLIKRYRVKRLVWFEAHADFPPAILRETQLKRWNRAWKPALIESVNPRWRDLWEDMI